MTPGADIGRGQQEVVAHKELYRSLVEHSVDSMLIADLDGRVLMCNEAMAELIGYRTDEIEGHFAIEFLHPDDVATAAQRIADGTAVRSAPRRLVRQNGVVIQTESTVSPFLSAGIRVGAFVSYQDVSAHLAVSEALRHSEAQLANAQTLAGIGSWEFDLARDSWQCSDEFYRVLGVERRGISRERGISHRAVLDTAALRTLVPRLDALLGLDASSPSASGVVRSATVTLANGEQRFIEARTAVTVDHAGLPLFMEGTVQDVTERERVRRSLEERNAELEVARLHARAILDSSSEAMLLVDTNSHFVAVNARFEEFFGLSPESIIGRSFADIAAEFYDIFADSDTLIAAVAGTARDRLSTFTVDVKVLKPAPRQLLLYSTPVNRTDDGQLARLYAFRDVTKEREAERVTSEFVSMVSHEMRTPLTSVKGYLDLFIDVAGDSLSDAQRGLLDGVSRNVERLLTLIGDLLDAARIEAGHMELAADVLAVAGVVQQAVAGMQAQLRQKHQVVEVGPMPQDLHVRGDRDRIDQILTNLLSNASKYSGEGTTVRIRAHAVGAMVAIAVEDDGIGISAKDLPHIFDRFYRVLDPAAPGVGGTGLGLSITRSLVELQGGSLAVHSDAGAGTTFTFTVPTVVSDPSTADDPPKR